MRLPNVPRLLCAILSTLLAATVVAQCQPTWGGTDAPARFTGGVWEMIPWDPDGAGPASAVLVAAGHSGPLGNSTTRIATFDGTRWSILGGNPPGQARAVVDWNGTLVAAFSNDVATWTGTAWQPIATAVGVNAMAIFNGELVVAGTFTSIGGVPANHIAKWNGAAWSALGAGIGGTCYVMRVFQNSLWVGGSFTTAGGAAAGNLAIWNGTNWVAAPFTNGAVWSMAPRIGTALTQTFLFVGGTFSTIAGVAAQHVARFSPSAGTWTAMGAGLGGTATNALLVTPTGLNTYDLHAAIESTSGNRVFRWDGPSSTWIGLGTGGAAIPQTLARWSGQLFSGCYNGTDTMDAVAGLSNGSWVPLVGAGIDGNVQAVLADGASTIVAGTFAKISGVPVGGLARGTPGDWQGLGGGTDGGVYALARLPNGDVVAGGSFATAGGVAASNIARWDGTSWSPLGAGTNGAVLALRTLANGDLLAGGVFTQAGGGFVNHVARWNGSFWTSLGVGVDDTVYSLLQCSNGDVIVGGAFTNQGARIARWNGFVWSPLGSGSQFAVVALAELPDGRVLASGGFSPVGSLAAWNGSSWGPPHTSGSPPNLFANALLRLADGSVAAVGNALGSNDCAARLQNGAWTPLGFPSTAILAIDQAADGSLRIGGTFLGDDTLPAKFAPRDVPCPAAATTFAPGCPSSGGSNTLTTTTLPWANGTFRATGTGLPTTALVLAVTSVTPIVPGAPLSLVFAQAGPGCNLHVAPDLLGLLVTTNGTVVSELALPNTPPLVGVTFFHQLVPIEVDALGNWIAVTATNALQLTAGIF